MTAGQQLFDALHRRRDERQRRPPEAIGNLGWNDIRLTAPVFIGDTIYAESEVLTKRESAKRPTQGIVGVRTIGKKADGTLFMSFERTVLIPKRGHAVDDLADY